MKAKEFIKRVEELGYSFSSSYYCWEIRNKKNHLIAVVSKDVLYKISTDSAYWDVIPDEDKNKLLELIVEFASTPVEDREEEKKFYIKHKWIGDETLSYLQFDREHNCHMLNLAIGDNSWKKEFTEEEIEGFKQTFNTNLEDFEIIEVKDEN